MDLDSGYTYIDVGQKKMDLRFRPDLKPGNNRFLLGALKNQAKSKKKGITNPTSLRTSFARELQTKPKQYLSQKNYTRTAQPARLPGELTIAPPFDVHLFCSLHYWGVTVQLYM